MKYRDSFSALHPAVNLIFFLDALVWTVVLRHPAWTTVSLLASGCYYGTLTGRKALHTFGRLFLLILALTALNPIFNTRGEHTLFMLFGRPYTWEALCYGGVIAGMFSGALLWFLCWERVMTEDKLTVLLSSHTPALSLLLVMVLRLVPAVKQKAGQITDIRKCINPTGSITRRRKLNESITVLSTLTSCMLEGGVTTADSMRARGYGSGHTSAYLSHRWQRRDLLCLLVILMPTLFTILCFAQGRMYAGFLPALRFAHLTPTSAAALTCYALLLFIPTLLHIQEELKWLYWNSNI